MTASFFETRQGIWCLTFVIPTDSSLCRMESRFEKRWWWLVRMRHMTCMRKSTATVVPRDMRLKNFQLVIDEQSLVRIKPDSLCCETKTARRLRTPEPPTDAVRMLHTTTHVPFRDWCPFCVVSRGRSFPHRRVVMNKTADILPKFQTDYMFIRTVEESQNSWNCPSGANFWEDVWTDRSLMKCPRSQAGSVSRQWKLFSHERI